MLRYKYKAEDLARFAKWQDGKYTRNLVDTGHRLTTNLLSADNHCMYKNRRNTEETEETHFFIFQKKQFLIFQETTTST